MTPPQDKQDLLRAIPPITELLNQELVQEWLKRHPRPLVTNVLRHATTTMRRRVLEAAPAHNPPQPVTPEAVLRLAAKQLEDATTFRLREAINGTGIILHTGLGRAVFPAGVVDSIQPELQGCINLAVDRDTGERIERDELIEPLLCELTGAEAATVVNNNAAATLLVLAALASGKEVLVSRGQLIEIGGSFRLPDVMAQGRVRLVEVGTTNRTHLKDFDQALGPDTAAILRVHPSNFRVVGFTAEPALADLVDLAHRHGLLFIDDLGAGALLDLEEFGLPHEPTLRESLRAGADIVLCSGDKLIGASQCGIIAGRKAVLDKIRKHPLMRAVRVDKTCLLVLERTLHLFRDPELLKREHPTYRMISTPLETLRARGERLVSLAAQCAPLARLSIADGLAYLGSGSLPTQAIPSLLLRVTIPNLNASELARRLRLDAACVFGRIEADQLCLDLRTVTDAQVEAVAAALGRVSKPEAAPTPRA